MSKGTWAEHQFDKIKQKVANKSSILNDQSFNNSKNTKMNDQSFNSSKNTKINDQSFNSSKSNKLNDQLFKAKKSFKFKFPYTLFRNVALIVIAGAFFYDTQKVLNPILNYFHNHLNLSQQLYLQTIKQDLILRTNKLKKLQFQYDKNLPNKLYISKLQGLLCRMQTQSPTVKLHERYQAKFRFWILGINANKETTIINNYGDIIKQKRKYKFSLGQRIGFRSKEQELLKQSEVWAKIRQSIKTQKNQNEPKQDKKQNRELQFHERCKHINVWNRLSVNSQQYEKLIADCQQQVQKIEKKIIKQIRKKQQKYNGMI